MFCEPRLQCLPYISSQSNKWGQWMLPDWLCLKMDLCRRLGQNYITSTRMVLQERLLAPRTLHFTSTQVFWECSDTIACKSLPDKLPKSAEYDRFFDKQPVTKLTWKKTIELYTSCNLTYDKDKLPAIYCVAQIIKDQTHDNYVAGLCLKDLQVQLCWERLVWPSGIDEPLPAQQRPSPYRAPTWSWESIDGMISVWDDADILISSIDNFVKIPRGKKYVWSRSRHLSEQTVLQLD